VTGFYKMHRGWMNHPVFGREPFTRAQAWMWLIEHAAWKDTTQPVGRHHVRVQRGQIVVAVRYLAEAWMWSKSSVDRFLTRLETGTMIGTQPGTQYSIITICNYEKYQGDWDTTGTQPGTQPGTRVGHDRDKEEEVNKDKKTTSSDDPAFAEFWDVYPKREGRADALKAWRAATKKAGADSIIAAARRYSEKVQVDGTDQKFIKLAGGWLRAERWNDFPLQPAPDLLTTPAPPAEAEDDEVWRERARKYHEAGNWLRHRWGPDLLSRDCRVPPDLKHLFTNP
jgi:hypothetical protein